MENPFVLTGKTILITGGAGGIGSAVAKTCVSLGARVILTDIREEALTEAGEISDAAIEDLDFAARESDR